MEVTNKINIIALHHAKATKTMPYEGEIFDYVLYNRALWNAVTSNEVIFKLWRIDETFIKKNLVVHFKNGDIVLWKSIFLLSEEILTFLKNFEKTI